jgi:hypothetical protein
MSETSLTPNPEDCLIGSVDWMLDAQEGDYLGEYLFTSAHPYSLLLLHTARSDNQPTPRRKERGEVLL